MGVGGDELAPQGGLVDDEADLVPAVLGPEGRRPDRGHRPTGGHDLEAIRSGPQVFPGDPPDRLGGVGLPAHVPAVPARMGDRPGRADQVRTDGEAGLDGVAQLDVEEVATSEVAGRGDTGRDELSGIFGHAEKEVGVALPAAARGRVDPTVEPHVDVGVDEPGEESASVEVDDLDPLADVDRPPSADVADHGAVDQDLAVLDHLARSADDHRAGPQQLHDPSLHDAEAPTGPNPGARSDEESAPDRSGWSTRADDCLAPCLPPPRRSGDRLGPGLTRT